MQTTLLGLAIAVILALVAALVGPHFVDWNQYRGEFEARASSITGLSVRIAGPVEARLLPTPALTLQRIEVTRPGDAGVLRVRSLGIEFSLGALVRGEWRATMARLDGAEITAGLDSAGRLDWPVPSIAVDPDTVSIERLDIVDGRAILADAVGGSSRPRQAGVQGRAALVRRSGQRRGFVRRWRAALSLSGRGEPGR